MHGSSYSGDAALVLESLADSYDDLLKKGASSDRGWGCAMIREQAGHGRPAAVRCHRDLARLLWAFSSAPA